MRRISVGAMKQRMWMRLVAKVSVRSCAMVAVLAVMTGVTVPRCLAQSAGKERVRQQGWQATLRDRLPLLGHRNWILVVDSAYPLQTTPGMEVVETHMGLLPTLKATLAQIGESRHVRANVFQDAELREIPESDAPGITRFRKDADTLLRGAKLAHAPLGLPHLTLIGKVADASKDFQILVLKSDETLPYTSVFLQLDCKYWSDDAEKRLRAVARH
ncbi:MAG: hypothetical protein JWM54_968 [Acidobacteriaceae bacterium]|nr:hypothetical protein [Acidobacteriaceae bacterium]